MTEMYPSDDNCLLTVVVPVYNRGAVVGKTLEAIERQTLRPLRVIVVDNNSVDNSLAVVREWKRRVENAGFEITVLEENIPGAAAARNRGLQEVTTPLTMFFDSDDIMSPEHCRRAVEGFRTHPDADIVGWDCGNIALTGKRRILRFSSRDMVWGSLHYGYMATQRYVARTDLFRRAGGWNPACKGWNDIEFGLRILMLSPKVVKLSGKPTVEIVSYADSITGRNFSAKADVWESTLDMMEDTVRRGENAAIVGKQLRYLNLRRAILAGNYAHEGAMAAGVRLIRTVTVAEPSSFYRSIYRAVYRYASHGGRFVARLLRPIF